MVNPCAADSGLVRQDKTVARRSKTLRERAGTPPFPGQVSGMTLAADLGGTCGRTPAYHSLVYVGASKMASGAPVRLELGPAHPCTQETPRQALTFFRDSGIQEVGIAQRHPPAEAPPGPRPGVTSGPEWASLFRVKQPRPHKRRPGGASPVRRDPRLFLQNRAPRTPAVPAGGPFAPIVPGAATGEPRGRRS